MNSRPYKSGPGAAPAILLALAMCFSIPAFSDSVDDGLAAFKRGDRELAYKNWLPLAIKGDARAQFFLSVLYEQWTGGEEDRKNARRWLIASANNGFIPAQFNLGNNYHLGKYGRANNKMAAYWWEQAAIQGFVEAQYRLGSIYYWGVGIELDLKESFYWFDKAARNGSQRARAAMLQARAGTLERDRNAPVNITYDDPRIVTTSQAGATGAPAGAGSQAQVPAPEAPAVMQEHGEGATPDQMPEPSRPAATRTLTVEPEPKAEPEPDWVQQQPATNSTIQLFASGRMQHCEEYAGKLRQDHGLDTRAYAFSSRGNKLCAVLVGSYPQRAEAMTGLQQLPGKLRRDKPWIRNLGKLQRLGR
jgi:hypothetical protein